jgi:hypothetical protein
MADWGMAAVVLAIITLCFTSPPVKGISFLLSNIQRRIWPSNARCEQMFWSDIPDGKVHQCTRFCSHWGAHSQQISCWKTTLAQVFNFAWMTSRRIKSIRKPDELAFSKHFLCTDVDTILAFILCTVGGSRCLSWDSNSLRFGDTIVTLREHHGVLVAHLRGNINPNCVNLTKHEVQMMLHGYPPYYREGVIVKHGPCLPHPIRDDRDIKRAGWIIAAGLSTTTPLTLYIRPLTDNHAFYTGAPFNDALLRVVSVLQDVILKKFPNDQNIHNVISAITYMIVSGTASGVEHHGIRHDGVPGGALNQLNGEQCYLAMKIFNDFEPLTADQEIRLRPILAPVLNAAFLGAAHVITYVKDTGMQLTLPPLLRKHRHTPVYLMDCIVDADYSSDTATSTHGFL